MANIVETFPGTVGIGITNPDASVALDISGTLKADSFTVNGVSNSFFPIGSIAMWKTTTPPTGWALCDGANGTPDLRNRFIIGAGSTYNPGAKGGTYNTTLSTANIPSHTHTVATSQNGSHLHPASVSPESATGHGHTPSIQSGGQHAHTVTNGQAGSHLHPTSMATNTHNHPTGWTTSTGNHGHNHSTDRVALLQPANSNNTPRGVDYTPGEPNLISQFQRWQPSGGHSHNFTSNSFGNHVHNFTIGNNGSHAHSLTTEAVTNHTHTYTTNQMGSHIHPISSQSGGLHAHTGTTQATGSTTTFDIRPSYYVLVFIMKIS